MVGITVWLFNLLLSSYLFYFIGVAVDVAFDAAFVAFDVHLMLLLLLFPFWLIFE